MAAAVPNGKRVSPPPAGGVVEAVRRTLTPDSTIREVYNCAIELILSGSWYTRNLDHSIVCAACQLVMDSFFLRGESPSNQAVAYQASHVVAGMCRDGKEVPAPLIETARKILLMAPEVLTSSACFPLQDRSLTSLPSVDNVFSRMLNEVKGPLGRPYIGEVEGPVTELGKAAALLRGLPEVKWPSEETLLWLFTNYGTRPNLEGIIYTLGNALAADEKQRDKQLSILFQTVLFDSIAFSNKEIIPALLKLLPRASAPVQMSILAFLQMQKSRADVLSDNFVISRQEALKSWLAGPAKEALESAKALLQFVQAPNPGNPFLLVEPLPNRAAVTLLGRVFGDTEAIAAWGIIEEQIKAQHRPASGI